MCGIVDNKFVLILGKAHQSTISSALFAVSESHRDFSPGEMSGIVDDELQILGNPLILYIKELQIVSRSADVWHR